MIATIGIPGSSNFAFRHFNLRGRALDAAVSQWRAEWLAKVGEDQETLNAVRQGFTITDRQARAERWRDGSHIYTLGGSLEWASEAQ